MPLDPSPLPADDVEPTDTLTRSQLERRERVIRAAMELGAEGGYDAVQMRDVSQRAGVALGTIYRYFSSKDHLLAAALVVWADDLERQVSRRPPAGDTVAERMIDILSRATGAMEREAKLSAAVVQALTSADPSVSRCQQEMNEVMGRIQARAFPDDFPPEVRDGVIRTLEHVWFSALLGWVNGWLGIRAAGDELATATHLLLDRY
jgi:TetR/AcrR family transcriptional regulator, cholesterol catabolism regulator